MCSIPIGTKRHNADEPFSLTLPASAGNPVTRFLQVNTFSALTNRSNLKQLEEKVLMLSVELAERYGCDNMELA